jgi:hopanoid biosynthesis associated RND transporter like protein HpnN
LTTHRQARSTRFLAGWIEWACRFAWAIIVLAVLITAGACYFTVTHLRVDASVDKMLSQDLPFRRNEIAIGDAFPQTKDVLSVIVEAESAEGADDAATGLAARLKSMPDRFRRVFYPEGDPFFRRNGLLYLSIPELEKMSDLLAQAQPLLASLSADPTLRGLTGILRLAIDQSDEKAAAALAPALNKMASTVRNLEEGREARLSWQSLLDGSEAENATATRKYIVVQPVLNHHSLEPVSDAVAAIDQSVADLKLDESRGVEIRLTGTPLMLQEELDTVQSGMGIVGMLSLGMVLILLVLGLQSLRLVAATLFTLVVGLGWTAAFAVAAYGALNIISVAFAVLFIGLSVDFGIHYALRYREALADAAHGEALKEAGTGVGLALLLSAITAAIGFLSFLPTDYRGVSELGVISGFGMFVALLLNLTLLPALLYVMPMRIARATRWAKVTRRTWYQTLMRRHALGIVIFAAIVGAAAASITPYAWFDDDPLNLRDPNSPSVRTLLDVLDDPRTEPYSAELLVPNIETAARLASEFKKLPQVKKAETVLNLIPAQQEDKRAVIDEMALILSPLLAAPKAPQALTDAERGAAFDALRTLLAQAQGGIETSARNLATVLDRMPRTPDSLEALERALLGGFPQFRDRLVQLLSPEVVSLDNLPEALRGRRLAPDGRALVVIDPRHDLREPAARQEFVDAVRSVSTATSGPPVRFTAVGETVVGAFKQAALTAGFLIVLLLFWILRRAVDVVLVLAPLALAVLMTVAFTVLLKQPFNLANIIVLPLILGLGVAFGIQIVMRHRSDNDGTVMESSTPRAVVFSALTTIGSFGALALSSHPGTASMGFLLMLSITLTMVCTLLVLPALLELTGRKDRPKVD